MSKHSYVVYGKYDKHDTVNQHNVCHVHTPLKNIVAVRMCQDLTNAFVNLMFIGPCIIVLVEELKTNLMSLAILFHFLCTQRVSDINISIIRSLRLCC